MKRKSVGIPLTIAMLGTIFSVIWKNKSIHLLFGIALVLMSGVHFFQHNKKIKKDFRDIKKGLPNMNLLRAIGLPANKLDWFLRSIKVKSFIPGRIRIYSNLLLNNEKNKLAVMEELSKYKELDNVAVNTITGSVLIEYDPERIKTNTQLVEIEAFIKNKMK